jgi:lysozyme family protein
MDDLLMEIIEREGHRETDNPNDSGGRTKFGISERFHPEAWKDGPPTLEQAKNIYFAQYVILPGFHNVRPDYLMEQLADFGVLSGPATAIKHLQRILHVEADGELGPITLGVLAQRNPLQINNLLVDARIRMFVRLAQRRPKDLMFLFGWVERALKFRRDI